MMSHEFNQIRDLAKNVAGLIFTADKAYLVESRLTPVLQTFQYPSITELCAELRKGSNAKLQKAVIDALTINETSFFRDSRPFDTLRNVVLPSLIKSNATTKTLKIWCAAASTGQEPYSIAVVLVEAKAQMPGWSYSITGTDISPNAIERAKKGTYSSFEVNRGLSEPLRSRYFEPVNEQWSAKANIRSRIRFAEQNLMGDLAALGQFDIVFCRNVLIYFDVETKQKVIAKIRQCLQPNGFLFLGAAETIIGLSDQFQLVPQASGLYKPALPHASPKAKVMAA
jgi:chemotaxis protein methyltransferase CheR